MPLPGRPSDPVAVATWQLLHDTVDGPQRDYYLSVRMEVLRNADHGYEMCGDCGDPFLPSEYNHTNRMYGAAHRPHHTIQAAAPAA